MQSRFKGSIVRNNDLRTFNLSAAGAEHLVINPTPPPAPPAATPAASAAAEGAGAADTVPIVEGTRPLLLLVPELLRCREPPEEVGLQNAPDLEVSILEYDPVRFRSER